MPSPGKPSRLSRPSRGDQASRSAARNPWIKAARQAWADDLCLCGHTRARHTDADRFPGMIPCPDCECPQYDRDRRNDRP